MEEVLNKFAEAMKELANKFIEMLKETIEKKLKVGYGLFWFYRL